MSTNSISPHLPPPHEAVNSGKANATPDPQNGTREVAGQSRNVYEGNVTAPEKVSPDMKKERIDLRQQEPHRMRSRVKRVDVRG